MELTGIALCYASEPLRVAQLGYCGFVLLACVTLRYASARKCSIKTLTRCSLFARKLASQNSRGIRASKIEYLKWFVWSDRSIDRGISIDCMYPKPGMANIANMKFAGSFRGTRGQFSVCPTSCHHSRPPNAYPKTSAPLHHLNSFGAVSHLQAILKS